MIKEIKSIPLASFLSRLGHEPETRKGTRFWYKSPLRQEHTPSFKVDTTLNCWYDFGLGRGGNIIDLAAELYQSTDLRYLMRCIADRYPVPSVPTVASSFAPRHSAPSMERFEVVPLEHRALSHTSKSVVSRHTSPRRIAGRPITASTVNHILPWHLRMSVGAGNCATDISKVVGDARTSHICRGREMARHQSVPCSRAL